MWHFRSADDGFWHVYGSSAQAELKEAAQRGRPTARVVLNDGSVVDVDLVKLQHVGLHSQQVPCPIRFVPDAVVSPPARAMGTSNRSPARSPVQSPALSPELAPQPSLVHPPTSPGRFTPSCQSPERPPVSPLELLPGGTFSGLTAEALATLQPGAEDPMVDSQTAATQASIKRVARWLESLQREDCSELLEGSSTRGTEDWCCSSEAFSEGTRHQAPSVDEGSRVLPAVSSGPAGLEVTQSMSSTASSWWGFAPRFSPALKLFAFFRWGARAEA
eukprot:RCo003813